MAYGAGRDLLIAATVQVVADKGLRGLTFRAVADHARVNNSLVAHHFGTREALMSAALEWTVERSIETTRLPDLTSPEAFTDALLESITAEPELQAFQYEMILEARRNPVFADPVARLYQRYQDVVSQSLSDAGLTGDVAAAARQVFASLDGLVLQYLAGVDVVSLRAAVHDIWVALQARGLVS